MPVVCHHFLDDIDKYLHQQELSYRKQIARQLYTKYVEGIHRLNYPVTLKSRLRVTEGRWKQYNSIDHT